MGKLQRTKGKVFERLIASALRERYPAAEVRRTLQSQRAWDSDVVIDGDGVPNIVRALWLECEHSRNPAPRKKMMQALRDIGASATHQNGALRIPVVVWRLHRKQTIWTTLHLGDLNYLRNPAALVGDRFEWPGARSLVNLHFVDFVALLPG